jgi:ferritin-like protein
MDKTEYYYNNIHLLGIQGMQKNTISSILKRAKFFNDKKNNKK